MSSAATSPTRATRLQDHVELAGEHVQFGVGDRQSGEPREIGDIGTTDPAGRGFRGGIGGTDGKVALTGERGFRHDFGVYGPWHPVTIRIHRCERVGICPTSCA